MPECILAQRPPRFVAGLPSPAKEAAPSAEEGVTLSNYHAYML
jgi:hypothetical protein